MSCTTIYRNATVRQNYPVGVLLQGFAHAMYNCRIEDNSGAQIGSGKGASVSLSNCLIVGRGPQQGGAAVELEYGRLEHCTILNSAVGLSVTVGGAVRNSIVSNCATVVKADKDALTRLSLDKTILGLGEANFGGEKVNAAGWADFVKTCKGATGAIIDAPVLEAPLYALPADSAHLKAGDNETPPGAQLRPYKDWAPQE